MKTLSVVVPAYNEERFLGALLERIRAVDLARLGLEAEVLVVDDGSTDRTAEIAAAAPGVALLRQGRNQGKGSAVRAGIARARGDFVMIQDADLEYEPEDYLPMLEALLESGADAVYGSRYLLAGRHPEQSWAAYLGGRSLSLVAWLLTGARLSDTVTALKLFRREAVSDLELETTGFETDHEITARLCAAGARIREVPIGYAPRSRDEGKKIGLRDWFRAVRTFWRHGHRRPGLEDVKALAMRSRLVMEAHARLVFPRTVPADERGDRDKQERIRRVKSHTLLHYPRLSALHDAARALDAEGVPGAFVECGVWNGGSAGLLAQSAPDRALWLFDSWQGQPPPGADDVSHQGSRGRAHMFRASRARVERLLFQRLGVARDRVHLVEGWYEDTLPARRAEIPRIALLHLDCDWYASVRLALESFWDALVPGGALFVDDYGYWRGCRRAVDEFFAARGERPQWTALDASAVWWRRP